MLKYVPYVRVPLYGMWMGNDLMRENPKPSISKGGVVNMGMEPHHRIYGPRNTHVEFSSVSLRLYQEVFHHHLKMHNVDVGHDQSICKVVCVIGRLFLGCKY